MQHLMYCIKVKEQFNVRFMDKGNHISQQRYHMFQARSVFEATCILSFTYTSNAIIFGDNYVM